MIDDLDQVDRTALERAVAIYRGQSPENARELAERIAEDGWHEAALFVIYGQQIEALHLAPWQEPPCVAWEDDPAERDKSAQALLRRMLAAGVSRYDPDPLAALAERRK